MKDTVTIVVPVYNVEKYLNKCIESLQRQTYKNLEIILVDDGSPDCSGQICDQYAAIDSRIKVIHKQNGGLSDARNAAIDIASGEYITFVDSDDYIEHNCIEYLYTLLRDNQADMSICELNYITEQGEPINHPLNNDVVSCLDCRQALAELLDTRRFSNSASGKLYKTELFEGIRYPVGELYEDIATTYKLILKSSKIVFGARPYYYYIKREGSIQTAGFSHKVLDAVKFVEQMTDEIIQHYPELDIPSSCRRMDTYYSTFKIINKKEYPSEYNSIYDKIVDVRKHVMMCRGCKPKRRIIACMAYLPKSLFWRGLQFIP